MDEIVEQIEKIERLCNKVYNRTRSGETMRDIKSMSDMLYNLKQEQIARNALIFNGDEPSLFERVTC